MGKFIKLLDDNYKESIDFGYEYESKIEYVGSEIFDFTTYDGNIDILFANKMIDVIKCILSKTTFEYQKDNYIDYLTMVNMPFLVDKLEWGSSIRGSWFDDYKEYEINYIKIKQKELEIFMKDLIKWCYEN